MDRRNFLLKLNKFVILFEVLISMLLLLGIAFSIPDIFKYYVVILKSDINGSTYRYNNNSFDNACNIKKNVSSIRRYARPPNRSNSNSYTIYS